MSEFREMSFPPLPSPLSQIQLSFIVLCHFDDVSPFRCDFRKREGESNYMTSRFSEGTNVSF